MYEQNYPERICVTPEYSLFSYTTVQCRFLNICLSHQYDTSDIEVPLLMCNLLTLCNVFHVQGLLWVMACQLTVGINCYVGNPSVLSRE